MLLLIEHLRVCRRVSRCWAMRPAGWLHGAFTPLRRQTTPELDICAIVEYAGSFALPLAALPPWPQLFCIG